MFLSQRRQQPTAMVKNHLQKEADEQLRSDSESPHFFKIILQDTLEHGKLVFPKRFIRLYGEKLSSVVRLRVPTGDVWEMELRRCIGTVWLENKSWASFASFYNLGFGYILVFRLVKVGISEFEVLIFDTSTVGINYPRVNCSIKAESSDSGFMQDQVPVIGPQKSLRDRDELPLQMNPLKKMKISKASSSNREKVQKRDHNKKKMHRLNSMEKEEALVRAESFQSTNPYFKLVMQPSYVNSNYTLCPSQFMQTYMPDVMGELKLVCASNGKTWTARYHINKAKLARMNHGWDTFAKENQLVVGDVCVFELINGAEGEVSFKVTIFRAPRAAKSKTAHVEAALTSKSIPRHPFFKIVIQFSSTTLVTIPASFAKKHFDLEKKEQMLTLEVGDRSWPVKLLNYNRKSELSFMSAGVSTFIKENSLKVGDLCTFELIDSKQMVFKVSISRNATV